MEPVKMPDGNQVSYWKELLTALGFAFLWWKNGREVGKVEGATNEKLGTMSRDIKALQEYCLGEDGVEKVVEEKEYVTFKVLADKQELCLSKRKGEIDIINLGLVNINATMQTMNESLNKQVGEIRHLREAVIKSGVDVQ